MRCHHLISSLLIIGSSSVNNCIVSGFNVSPPTPANSKKPTTTTTNKISEEIQKDNVEFVVRLEVGEDKKKLLVLNNFHFKLLSEEIKDKNHPKLPGVNGPNARVSGGARRVEIESIPSYIDMSGMQKVMLENGCWELIKRDDASARTVVCGFDAPNEATRNGAKLPSGLLYLSFVLWTKKELAEAQAQKAAVHALANKNLKEKEDAMKQYAHYSKEGNFLMKAISYRNAAKAVEKFELSGIRAVTAIPDDGDVFPIQNNNLVPNNDDELLIATKGTVWTKKKQGFMSIKQKIGSVIILPQDRTNNNDDLRNLRP